MKRLLNKTGLSIIIAIVILIAAVMFIQQQIQSHASRPIPQKQENTTYPTVTVEYVNTGTYSATITGYGELTPHFSLSLAAEVSGQIININEQLEVGNVISKGEWLAKIDPTNYLATVKEAEQAVSEAKLALLEEERQVLQAQLEWKSSGIEGQPDSELVLREPQLQAAKSTLAHAEATLAYAKKELERTTIKAPFNAVITERQISLGSYVQTGSDIVSIYSIDRLEAVVPLSGKDWRLIDENTLSDANVSLKNIDTQQNWLGRVLRSQRHVDSDTRQRSIIVAIDEPQNNQAYSGMFVSMTLSGKPTESLWKLPTTALSQRGEIWYVNSDNELHNFSTSPLFNEAEFIYVSPPDELIASETAIVVQPLNSYVKGMKVSPVSKGDRHV
jgi:RND family efflux transporter MFP subunit